MTLSIHDNYVVSYEIRSKGRMIVFKPNTITKTSPSRPQRWFSKAYTAINSRYDAFGNIIYGLYEIPVEQIIQEQRAEIAEPYLMSGAPGPCAAELVSAARVGWVERSETHPTF
jgi:hypothetical protein